MLSYKVSLNALSTPLHYSDPALLLQKDRLLLTSQHLAHSRGDIQIFSNVGAVSLDTGVGGGGWGSLNHYDVGASDTLSVGISDQSLSLLESRARYPLWRVEDCEGGMGKPTVLYDVINRFFQIRECIWSGVGPTELIKTSAIREITLYSVWEVQRKRKY